MNRIFAVMACLASVCMLLAQVDLPLAVNKERPVVFIKPVSFEKIKWDNGDKGFKLEFKLTRKDFGWEGKQMPEVFMLSVWGPQPTNFDRILVKSPDKIKDALPWNRHGGTWLIDDNLHDEEVGLELSYRENPDYIKDEWKNVKIKVITHFMGKEAKRSNLCSEELWQINGVIGSGLDKNKWHITLAKGHPQLEKIKKDVEAVLKKYEYELEGWAQKDGYDYLWEKKEKK